MIIQLQANTTSLYLSWEEPANNNAPILMYHITVQAVDDESGNAPLVFTSNTTELYVNGLTPFTEYSVQVVAVNSIGSSAPSQSRKVMTAEGSESVSGGMHTSIHAYYAEHLHTVMHCIHIQYNNTDKLHVTLL